MDSVFQHIITILETQFQPITLAEMDEVKLMDRTDTKYVFRAAQLPFLLEQLKGKFKALEVSGKRASRYETLYYDTPELELYHKHQTKRTNRHKIRSRRYVETDVHFLEVKLKNNKGRTIKNRMRISDISPRFTSDGAESAFLSLTAGYDAAMLLPQFWVNYERVTLVNLENKIRCTIDLNMNIASVDNVANYSDLVILELKQEKSAQSLVSALMKEMKIREGGLSKYCLGVLSQYPGVKQNNFKKKLSLINKLRANVDQA